MGKSIFFDDSKKKIAERGKNYQKLKNCSNGFRNGDFRPEKTAGMEVTQVRRGSAGVVQKSKEREQLVVPEDPPPDGCGSS